MVVRNSVTFSVTRIGSHVDRSKTLNHPGCLRQMLPKSKTVRHMSNVRHNWPLLKADRFPLSNTPPVCILVGPLTLEVDHIEFVTPVCTNVVYEPTSKPLSEPVWVAVDNRLTSRV